VSVEESFLSLFVPGWPRPKGSLKPQMVRDGGGNLTGRTRMVESSADSTRWLRTMAKAFRDAEFATKDIPYAGPVAVNAAFWFDPARLGVDIEANPYPVHPHIGDLDKLVRNLLDALQQGGVLADDRQVAQFGYVGKHWCTPMWTLQGVNVGVWAL